MRSKSTALILCFFLGGIGGHKFYLGQTFLGVMYLLFCWTFIPGLIALLEFFLLLFMSEDEFNRRFNFTHMMMGAATQHTQVAQNIVVNVPGHSTAPIPAAAPVDITAQLGRLNELRVAGAITDAEFAAQKAQLLGGATGAQYAPAPSQIPYHQ